MGTLLLAAQKRLLNAARGLLLARTGGSSKRVMRCFPLKERHVLSPPPTPAAFHEALCRKIRACRRRVQLASLYIGPAACPAAAAKEQELLDALASTPAQSVQILLDQSRALRPVPVVRSSNDAASSSTDQPQQQHQEQQSSANITSAEACHRVLERRRKNHSRRKHGKNRLDNENNDDGIYLLSVLPAYQQMMLKNPLNEVAGVFHLKCYIMDNDMVITGANLSEEYFVDRIDRYLWISSSTNRDDDGEHDDDNHPLVECYAELVQALCRHAKPYKEHSRNSVPRTTRQELLESLTEILTVEAAEASADIRMDDNNEEDIVSYAVPTLQAPHSFFGSDNNGHIPNDTDLTSSLIEHAAPGQEIRIASAYLNPTDQLRRSIKKTLTSTDAASSRVHFLTAGLASHGFKPKHKPGNKGRTWIPAVYDTLSRRRRVADRSSVWYYVRPGWTFHCKGLWLTTPTPIAAADTATSTTDESKTEYSPVMPASSTVSAVIAGSGNFGYRSAVCDLESNVILVFAATPKDKSHSQLQKKFRDEWNDLCRYAKAASKEDRLPLPWPLRVLLPIIRYFF